MRTLVGVLLLGLAAALGSTFMPQIRIFGGMPDLVLLLVLSLAIFNPLERAVTWALIGGIFQDMLSITPLGASAIGLVLMVFLVDWVRGQVFRVGLLTLLGLAIIGTAAQKTILLIVSALVGFPIRPIETAVYVILPTIIYNVIFLFPVYWFARRLSHERARYSERLTRS
ncbi:MAG: rod shape-determining protein MreD [Phototrophicales bacterium]|nr:MAG: rod shape-determining protein MreD [Phototrophicales bacterium]